MSDERLKTATTDAGAPVASTDYSLSVGLMARSCFMITI